MTSSTAKKIVDNIDEKDILFIPDYNLGSYIKKTSPDKNIILWNGMCPTHAAVTERDVEEMRARYPDALLLVHPECPPEIVKHADYAGSTSGIVQYALEVDRDCIIGTEISIANYLAMLKPERNFPVLSKRLICPNMRVTNLADVYKSLTGEGGEEIVLDEALRLAAKKPIDEMIRLGSMNA